MPMKVWTGRTDGATDELFDAINDSLPVDVRLVNEDIASSIAWAHALARAGVMSESDAVTIEEALRDIAEEANDDPQSVVDSGAEDIHTWIEWMLTTRLGELGKQLHTGRSRNDLVATDLRLWTMKAIGARREELHALRTALVELARKERQTILPGFTHLQRAQPILFAHWCMAYQDMLARDAERFADARKRTAECPLGCGALAGTAYPIDREELASDLGFDKPSANSLDAVSDRDFALETLSAISLCAVHLSRLAEDLIFYASSEADYVAFDDGVTSGSSMMPQKKNPDAMELLRGKAGGAIGAFVSLASVLKGLPLSYNKDLQEDKQILFDAMDNLSLSLRIAARVVSGLRIKRDRTLHAAQASYANATDLADLLTKHGVPFRDAYAMTGQLVREASEMGKPLEELPLEAIRKHAPAAPDDVRVHLTIDAALERRSALGGTAPSQVAGAIAHAEQQLGMTGNGAARSKPLSAVTIEPAQMDHLDAICRLVDYWAQAGENLPRSRDEIIASISQFAVAILDGEVVGCGSLYIYSNKLAEIRSLGVDTSKQGCGAGSALVQHLTDLAAELHIPRVFVLTRAPEFFERNGFRKASINVLPEKVFKDCQSCHKQTCCDEIAMVREPLLPS